MSVQFTPVAVLIICAQIEISKARKAIKDAKKKAKATYGNMFSKISVYDDKSTPVSAVISSASNKKVGCAGGAVLRGLLFKCSSFVGVL